MATKDHEKRLAASRRYRERKKIAKYGPEAAGKNMSGRHGNHARGAKSGKWNGGRLKTSHGYVAVRVPSDHPHGWGSPNVRSHRYAYEHIVVMMAHIGRPLRPDEVVHHKNGVKDDNRLENLALDTRSGHAKEHSSVPEAHDRLGRFAAGVPRTVQCHADGEH